MGVERRQVKQSILILVSVLVLVLAATGVHHVVVAERTYADCLARAGKHVTWCELARPLWR